jgi:hypothetical protein
MVRRRQLSAKKPKRVNEPLDFLASGGKRKAQKKARVWRATQAAGSRGSTIIAFTKDAFIANILTLVKAACKPLRAAEVPLLYRARFGTLLNRELIAQMDPTWIGVHALMQDPDVKATVTTMWDNHNHPVYVHTAWADKVDLSGFRTSASQTDGPEATASVPRRLTKHQTEMTVDYDVTAFPFRALWQTLLGATDLVGLHQAPLPDGPPPCLTLALAHRQAGHKLPAAWVQALTLTASRKHTAAFHAHPAYKEMLSLLDRFVMEVIVPLCGDPTGVWYQCRPTLRIHLPSDAPAETPRREIDVPNHSPDEIAFYVPLTSSLGSNALHTESEPEKGDYHPLCAEYGQIVRFNAAGCRHHAVTNQTGLTRVSLDFRVVPNRLYQSGQYIGHHRTTFAGPEGSSTPQATEARTGKKRKHGAPGNAEESLTADDLKEAHSQGSDSDDEDREGSSRTVLQPSKKRRRLDDAAHHLKANLDACTRKALEATRKRDWASKTDRARANPRSPFPKSGPRRQQEPQRKTDAGRPKAPANPMATKQIARQSHRR